MIVVSPYSTGGHISHTYTDHVSTAKFIERNWGLAADHQPQPRQSAEPVDAVNPYVPVNSPAIGDMMDMFDFSQPQTLPPEPPFGGFPPAP